jgi:hypothetical protein
MASSRAGRFLDVWSPTRRESAAVTQRQPAANWSYRPFAEIEIGRDPRNLAAALIHLFLGDQIGVVATLEDQAVAGLVWERFLGKLAQARWAVPLPMPNSTEIAAQERP